jgi:hypothetical protein
VTEPASPDPDVARDTAVGPAIGVGPIVALIGGIVFALSSWLNWLAGVRGASEAASAYDAPARFLVDVDAGLGGPSLGAVVLHVGVVVIIGAVVRGLGLLSVVGGLLGLVIVVLFSFQLNRLVDRVTQIPALADADLTDFLDFGEYAAAVGAVLAIVGGLLSLRRP